ncbi:Hypothetical predicted protein [Cloeon dipterum]|uniref:MBD domain-containing protein n=2 Tax=Cloeon dipterum TaxID=197152 RepID=A0A8S1C5G9_9INSE|nr:Hypothetical predicted protein [Cloeon dipterum]
MTDRCLWVSFPPSCFLNTGDNQSRLRLEGSKNLALAEFTCYVIRFRIRARRVVDERTVFRDINPVSILLYFSAKIFSCRISTSAMSQTHKLTEQLTNGFYRKLTIRASGRLVVVVYSPSGKSLSSREKLRSYLKHYKGAGIDPDIAFDRPSKSYVIESSQKGSEGSTQGPETNGSTEKSAPVAERRTEQSQSAKTKVTNKKRTKSDVSSQAPLDSEDTSQNLSNGHTETAVTNMLPPKNPNMVVKAEMKADSEKENSRQKRVLRTKASNPNANKDPEDSKRVSPPKKAKLESPAGLKHGKPVKGQKQPKDQNNSFIEVEAPLKSPYKLIYEDLALEPWKVIVGSFLMNRTIAIKGCCLVHLFFEEFPSLDKLMNKETLTNFFTVSAYYLNSVLNEKTGGGNCELN